jgi:ligand-binding sensor domain-containing protein/signal transduction histidine kinase
MAPGVAGTSLRPAVHSLAHDYGRRIWRVQDGLPQNRIQSITQTPDGYLWIGTSGGLVRFDGVRFSVFDRSNAPAFRDESILALYPSRDGSLWIGTEGGWLLHYRNAAFEVIGAELGLTNAFVRALYEDPGGTLWIGTDRGFFRLAGGRIERLDGTRAVPVTAITGISGDRDGRVWAAGGIGLAVVENGRPRRVMEARGLPPVRAVHEANDGTEWILTVSGLYRTEGSRYLRSLALDGLAPLTLSCDAEGNVWIGTVGEGLIRAGRAGVASLRGSDGLPNNSVNAVFQDREGNLWVGTGDGLLRLSRTAVQVVTTRDGLADDNVSSIYESRNKILWITTVTGSVYQYRGQRVVPFRLPNAAAGMLVRGMYEDSRGNLWFGSAGEGILRISGGHATRFTTENGLRSNMIRQFLEDGHGNVWIALGSGIARWDGRRLWNYYLEDGLRYGSVRVLMEDRGGDILAGTDGGLNRIHDGKFVPDALFSKLDGERIWALHEDAAGALWVGTRGSGLFRIGNGKVTRITVKQGLPSNAIFQVLEDGKGNFWMSSPAGVFSVPPSDLNRVADGGPDPLAAIRYGTADGLESTQMNGGYGRSACRGASGELWFPSVKGAVRIDPNRTRVSRPSPVLIESVSADERTFPVSRDIIVPPGLGRLQVRYTASSFVAPERMTFRYMLEGFDHEWSAPTRERVAQYTNLPAGRYRFHVAPTDGVSHGESSEAAISFVLSPPFYRTTFFYALCVTAAGLLAWISLRLYARQTKARYALLFAERTRLAREMHDTVIQGCAGISILLEAASSLQTIAADRTSQLLEQARVQARMTLDEARQAIWDLRQAHWSGDFSAMLRNLSLQLSGEKGIPIEVEFTGNAPQIEESARRGILLVAREAIRNAANHAAPGQIRVRVCVGSGGARLDVADDGCGFDPAREAQGSKGHYGIIGMRERVEQLGGRFLLRSSPGAGTTVTVELPLRPSREHAGIRS